MKYLQAAIDLGYPTDCATNGRSYEDLVRTWNRAYKHVPKLNTLQAHINEKLGNGEIGDTPLTPKPVAVKKKRFFGLF